MLTRLIRTYRRLAYAEVPFIATFGDEPLVDTSHISDADYDDVMGGPRPACPRPPSRRTAGLVLARSLRQSPDADSMTRHALVPDTRWREGDAPDIGTGYRRFRGVDVQRHRVPAAGFLVVVAPFWRSSRSVCRSSPTSLAAWWPSSAPWVPVYMETRWLFAFRLLEEAVGTRMTQLTIERPPLRAPLAHHSSGRPARLRDLDVRRGDAAHPDSPDPEPREGRDALPNALATGRPPRSALTTSHAARAGLPYTDGRPHRPSPPPSEGASTSFPPQPLCSSFIAGRRGSLRPFGRTLHRPRHAACALFSPARTVRRPC
jgi:hypothetical protein